MSGSTRYADDVSSDGLSDEETRSTLDGIQASISNPTQRQAAVPGIRHSKRDADVSAKVNVLFSQC